MCIHDENIDIHNWGLAIHNWNKDIHNWNINFHNWILDVHNWIMDAHNWIIKSPGIPGVTLCFCAGSHAPLPSPPPPTTYICSSDNFWTTFRIPFTFGTLGLKRDNEIWPWPWPWSKIFLPGQIWNLPYLKSSTKYGPIAMKWKANVSIEF